MSNPTHYAYLDESYYTTDHDFGAISLLSFPAIEKENLENEIYPLISKFDGEYKWQSFRGNSYMKKSIEIFDILFQYATRGCLRIDTIIWQTDDPRYPRNQSNSGEKLSVLYYLRLRDTLAKRWGHKTSWSINIDEHVSIDWEVFESFIDYASSREYSSTILGPEFDLEWLKNNPHKYTVTEINTVTSTAEPFIQIADIFAGLAAYSHNKSDKLLDWLAFDGPQHFNEGTYQKPLPLNFQRVKYKPAEISRFKFIKYIQDCCKSKKYQLSIRSKKGLHSYKPKNPINFFYSGCDK